MEDDDRTRNNVGSMLQGIHRRRGLVDRWGMRGRLSGMLIETRGKHAQSYWHFFSREIIVPTRAACSLACGNVFCLLFFFSFVSSFVFQWDRFHGSYWFGSF
jgi:hypothetical protein